jgi:hypothetical protein
MGALRMLMDMGVFDKIPQQGSISYRDLAASVGAEESLLSMCSIGNPIPGSYLKIVLINRSSVPMDACVHGSIRPDWRRPDCSHSSVKNLR